MQANALNPALNPALSPNAVPAANPALGMGNTGADSFSRMLEAADTRRQNERADSKAGPDAPKPPASGTPRPTQAAAKPAAPAETRGPARDTAAEARRTEAADARDASKTQTEEPPDDEAATDDSAPADAAALLASLGLALRPAPGTDSSRGRSAAASEAREDAATGVSADAAATGLAPTTAARRGAGAGGGDAGRDDPSRAETGFDKLLAQAAGSESATAPSAWLAETQALAAQPASAPAELRPIEGSLQGLAAAGAFGPQGTAGAADGSASAPAEARLTHSPGSPAFADELGTQISTFVREGVQHAKLQLHPLELGPVTVQIQLDGGSAHMSFAAEHAQTRQALEQALPTLASSLREAGLTLSGGGVFEQPRQQAQAEAGNGGPGGNGSNSGGSERQTDSAAVAAAPGARRRGVVDLVA